MTESRDITAEDARVAAQMEAEVGAEHVAEVYAKGLFGTTEQAGQTEAVLAEFDALMTDVLDRFPKFEAVLASVLVLPEEKSALIDRVFGGRTRRRWRTSSRSWPATAGSTACGQSTTRPTCVTTRCGSGSPCG